LDLVDPWECDLPLWQPGAHIDLILPTGRGGSKSIYEALRPGSAAKFVGPRNNFALLAAESYLFIAGGIGITPLLPMMSSVAARTPDWHLLYGGWRRASMAFLEDLSYYGSNVTIAPEDEFGLLDLDAALAAAPSDAAVYCCGPEPLITAVEHACERSGRPALHAERFAAVPGQSAAPLCEENAEFDVVLKRKDLTVHVPTDASILEALEEAGYRVLCSCREGYCGCCDTTVLEGIVDHRDEYLSQQYREGGKKIMICVSRSRSSRLVLDV